MTVKVGDSLREVLGGDVTVLHNGKNVPGVSGLNVLVAAGLNLSNAPVDGSTTSTRFAMAASGATATVSDPNAPQNAPAPQPTPYN